LFQNVFVDIVPNYQVMLLLIWHQSVH